MPTSETRKRKCTSCFVSNNDEVFNCTLPVKHAGEHCHEGYIFSDAPFTLATAYITVKWPNKRKGRNR